MSEASPNNGTSTLNLPTVGPTSPVGASIEDVVTERLLRDPTLPVERVQEVLALRTRLYDQRRQERLDQAKEDFFDSLAKVQSEIRRVVTDRKNDHTKSQYATYAALDRVVRPQYVKLGFSVTFNTKPCDLPNHIIETAKVTRGLHSEEYETPPMFSDNTGAQGKPTGMNKTQAVGSAMSYARRYLLINIFNIAFTNDPEDDDGNAAGGTRVRKAVATALTEQQIGQLYKLIEETGTNQDKFLEWAGVGILEDLPPSKYREATTFLNRRKAENAAAAEKKAAPAEQKPAPVAEPKKPASKKLELP